MKLSNGVMRTLIETGLLDLLLIALLFGPNLLLLVQASITNFTLFIGSMRIYAHRTSIEIVSSCSSKQLLDNFLLWHIFGCIIFIYHLTQSTFISFMFSLAAIR